MFRPSLRLYFLPSVFHSTLDGFTLATFFYFFYIATSSFHNIYPFLISFHLTKSVIPQHCSIAALRLPYQVNREVRNPQRIHGCHRPNGTSQTAVWDVHLASS